MTAQFTLTGNLGELLGSTLTRSAYVEPTTVIRDTGGNVVFGEPDSQLITGGLLSILLPADDASNLPHSSAGPLFGFHVTIGQRSWPVPAQPINTVLDLSDVVPDAWSTPLPATVIVLNSADSVPAGTPVGTIILRRT